MCLPLGHFVKPKLIPVSHYFRRNKNTDSQVKVRLVHKGPQSFCARPVWGACFEAPGVWLLGTVGVYGGLVGLAMPFAGPGVGAGPRQCAEAVSSTRLVAVALRGPHCDLTSHCPSPAPPYSVGFHLMSYLKIIRDHFVL